MRLLDVFVPAALLAAAGSTSAAAIPPHRGTHLSTAGVRSSRPAAARDTRSSSSHLKEVSRQLRCLNGEQHAYCRDLEVEVDGKKIKFGEQDLGLGGDSGVTTTPALAGSGSETQQRVSNQRRPKDPSSSSSSSSSSSTTSTSRRKNTEIKWTTQHGALELDDGGASWDFLMKPLKSKTKDEKESKCQDDYDCEVSSRCDLKIHRCRPGVEDPKDPDPNVVLQDARDPKDTKDLKGLEPEASTGARKPAVESESEVEADGGEEAHLEM